MLRRHFHELLSIRALTLLGFLFLGFAAHTGDLKKESTTSSSEDDSSTEDDSDVDHFPKKTIQMISKNHAFEVTPDNFDPNPDSPPGKVGDEKTAQLKKIDWDSLKKMLKKGVPVIILMGKLALDVYQIKSLLEQIHSADGITYSLINLPMANCSVICNSNVAGLRDNQYKSNVSNITSMVFAVLSAAGDLSSVVAYLKEGHEHVATLGLGGCFSVCDIIKCLSTFSANGYLWNAKQRFLADIPIGVQQALEDAINKGVPHLVASSCEALPCALALFYIYFCL